MWQSLKRLASRLNWGHIDFMHSPLTILAGALVVVAIIAVLGRWELVGSPGPGLFRLDRWTGAVQRCAVPKGNAKITCE
jgi:hypothetical protein